MICVNKVTLYGRAGKDAESKSMESGLTVAKFSLATSEKKKGGEEKTSWHNIVCFGKQAELAEQFVSKGDPMIVEGKIDYNEYTKDGVTKMYTSIICDRFIMTGHRKLPKDHTGGENFDKNAEIPF